ncbi:ATP-binding protein [Shimia sp. NS0008-38b]|uniref:AAA family ATPase n=1 Tax=Shimia sp. NS0008-38b TaxID=3127653 RepID=UPI00333FDE0B
MKLIVVCGKAASGKSTIAKALCQSENAVMLSEDEWLSALYGAEMSTLADYVRCAGKLRNVVAPHVIDLLKVGTPVVLDFQANTLESRDWMRGIAELSGAACELHYLDVSDDECKARLRVRNASGTHPFTLTEAQFDRLSAHFVAPDPSEGFEIVRHFPGVF